MWLVLCASSAHAASDPPDCCNAEQREAQARHRLAAAADRIEQDMTAVKGGCFLMGDGKEGGYPQEKPVHRVCVPDFGLARYPVTRKLWNAVMDVPAPDDDCGDDCPVEPVSWNDAQAFIGRLNGLGGRRYRLPSEAEWEYAAREGSDRPRAWGNEIGAGGRAWDRKRTSPVGSYKPNAFGLYDMLGNVFQWTEDCWHASYQGAPADGRPWSETGCTKRAVRGGSWHYYPHHVRAALRYGLGPDYRGKFFGFRLARALP